ncbi:MAG: hypothetical protein FWH44_03360 [Methanomassiliicoccaceae archaeon]|nr:hypothetical protein [Methanomassiliicoccaceae archaeon]
MDREITIVEDKVLKLKNVLSKELVSGDPAETQKSAHMFETYIRSKGLEPYGPMIIKTSVTFEDGRPRERKEIMVQIRDVPKKVEPPYAFTELLRVENCLLARYRGDTFNLPMAYGKMQVYAFEKEMDIAGETYTIVVEQNENSILADVFTVVRS